MMISFTETIVEQRFDEFLAQDQQRYGLSPFYLPYHDAIGQGMMTFLDDETLSFSRVAIMFGLESYLKEKIWPQHLFVGNLINDKATKLLEFLILAISGTVDGLQEFMATSPASICETLLSAGANPNAHWAGRDGGTLWTHLLFYYALRIKNDREIPDIATMEAFVRHGADLTACLDFRGTIVSPSGLMRFLMKKHPNFVDELTRVLELLEARMPTSPPVQITVSAPIESACAPQAANTSWSSVSSVEDAPDGTNPLQVSSNRPTSLSASRSTSSLASREDRSQSPSSKGRLLRKIFKR